MEILPKFNNRAGWNKRAGCLSRENQMNKQKGQNPKINKQAGKNKSKNRGQNVKN